MRQRKIQTGKVDKCWYLLRKYTILGEWKLLEAENGKDKPN